MEFVILLLFFFTISQEVIKICQIYNMKDKESIMKLIKNEFWQHKERCQESKLAFIASFFFSNTNFHFTTKESSSNKPKTKKRRTLIGLTSSQIVN